ncbi:hypothetical protein EHQ76_07410 [Leptospira barantonii]|uniref:Uncharacterized protein n=1 Tax=Leptospira barantonii TaxID=2023184 RepID=A0A5F2BHB8_9LEPT|nr:hypothetical protein [Leptospira barantonii]TGM04862.1 hypothetical protein EHQ76_07410 [Leptospira barantonii]
MRILEPEKRVSLNVNYEGGHFVFQAEIADPSTELDIEITVAKRLGGASLESIPNSVYGYLVATATLNHVIKEIPENFPTRINSFEEIRDKEFVIKLFNEYKKKELWFHGELKKNRDTHRSNFRRKELSRSHSHTRVQDSSERNHAPRESFSRTEKIPHRSNGENRHRELSETNETPFRENAGRENESERVSRQHQPTNGEYPRGRGRVLERTDPGTGRE